MKNHLHTSPIVVKKKKIDPLSSLVLRLGVRVSSRIAVTDDL